MNFLREALRDFAPTRRWFGNEWGSGKGGGAVVGRAGGRKMMTTIPALDEAIEKAKKRSRAGKGEHTARVILPDKRVRAANADMEYLAGRLEDSDWKVRLAGVWGLGLIGSAGVVDHLVRALEDEDERVQEHARQILATVLGRLTRSSWRSMN